MKKDEGIPLGATVTWALVQGVALAFKLAGAPWAWWLVLLPTIVPVVSVLMVVWLLHAMKGQDR